MHIPINDQHSLRPEIVDRRPSGYDHVINQTEPHRNIGDRVMARRSDGGERRLALECAAGHLSRGARGVRRRYIAPRAQERVTVHHATTTPSHRLEPLQIRTGMHSLEQAGLRRRGLRPLHDRAVIAKA